MTAFRWLACTALLQGAAAFEFLSIGDWGDPAAKELNPWMGKENPEFVIAIGADAQ